jgi:Ribonuclease G/E
VAPNDGQCHLNSRGFYDMSTVQDYPSLGHINHAAKQHSVNVIWAVTSSHLSLYQGLTQLLTASVAGEISSDSSNIVELIEDLYGKITTTVRVEDNSSESVSIHCMSDCNKKHRKKRKRYRNIPLGTQVEFTAHM